jgi:hypothetical protein
MLQREVGFHASGTEVVEHQPADSPSVAYRERMNGRGSPTNIVASGYTWMPGTELIGEQGPAGDGRGVHPVQQEVRT